MPPRGGPVWRPQRVPLAPVAAIVALIVVVSVAGLVVWPVPALSDTSAWMISDVPAVLWALLIGTTVLCMAVAVAVTGRTVALDRRDPVTLAWLALLLLSAAALVWNALYAAALSGTSFGAIIPIFHWLFTFLPAVLAGALFTRRGRAACWAAALGTGVVTVPLFQLFAVLLLPGQGFMTLLGSLTLTVPLAVLPLVGAVAIAGAFGDGGATDPRAHHFTG
jgi:hypothetical protein